ncbi:MAG: hypothetical protein AMS22_13050 [Thiotrichales bacterium SG8_50]|nr:MAG: hypothetical protein AMS22_13050 [Thiotrichales bacterium SG8_50]
MRDFSTPRTYIVSAYLQGASPVTNEQRHNDLVCDAALEGFPFRECDGAYKGAHKRSLVVVGALAESFVRQRALDYNQESFLCIAEHDLTAYFVNPHTNYHTHAGKFVAHGPTKPDTEGWTLCDGIYYVIQPTKGVDLPEGL